MKYLSKTVWPAALAVAASALFLAGCGGGSSIAQPKPLAELDAPAYHMQVIWHRNSGEGSGKFESGFVPATGGGLVYTANGDGEVAAFRLENGKRVWHENTDHQFVAGPGLAGDTLLIGTRNGDVVAVSAANGKTLWQTNLASEVLSAPSAAGDIAVARTVDGRVAALDLATGERLWTIESNVPNLTLRGTATPVIVETTDDTEFKVTPDQLRDAINDRTRIFILNSPSNPTGSVYTPEEIRALGDVCVEKGVLIMSDDIYEKLIYGDTKFQSVAACSPEHQEHTIIVHGLAKAYSMTGWRIGYCIAHPDLINKIAEFQSHQTGNPTSISQKAALFALGTGPELIAEMKQEYEKRRDFVLPALQAIDGISCVRPDGAFYLFPNVSECMRKTGIGTSEEFAKFLIQEARVAKDGKGSPLSATSNGKSIGPELGFGHVLGTFHGEQVLLIKTAQGNRSLGFDFRPPSSGRTDPGNEFESAEYRLMVEGVRKTLDNIAKVVPGYKGQGYEIAGFVWFQGHKDSFTEALIVNYEKNLTNLINDVRKEFKKPKLPAVVATIGFGGHNMAEKFLRIHKAQMAVGDPKKHPEYAGNVASVDTRDFWREVDESPTNQDWGLN